MGGDATIHKLFCLQACLGYFDNTVLVGKLGLAF